MKAHFFILSIILICLGCELIPEAMDPPADESVRKDYLQRGDTLDIPIESLVYENSENGTFSFKELGDTNIVSIIQQESILSIIGKEFGSTTVTAQFSDLEKNLIIYLNFTVLEGFPVFVWVGEESVIFPEDFIESIEGEIDSDSLVLSSDEDLYSFSWKNENNQNLVFTGMSPGTQKVLFSVLVGTQVYDVFLIVETSVRQVVMGEVFTNVGCNPCVPVNHELDEIFEEQNINMTIIRYHWNSPDPTDPMYHYNPTDVELRWNMYNILFCPVAVINGVYVRIGQGQIQNNAHGDILNENTINNELYIGHTSTLVEDSIIVDVEIRPFTTINDLVRVWAVVVEDSIEYEAYNGELIHMQVMRDLNFTDEWNSLIKDALYTSRISLLTPVGYSAENTFFYIITMVQSVQTNRIYQSNRFHYPLPIPVFY